jgi:hypothetical protein
MSTAQKLAKETGRIADAIVALVERTEGPVTLARLDREIPGFAQEEEPASAFVVDNGPPEKVIWVGMTEAGCMALRNVMSGRRVAVQLVSRLPYLLEEWLPESKNWRPIALLPVRAANLDAPRWLMRYPQADRDFIVAGAAAKGMRGYVPIVPAAGRQTADAFSP